MYHIIIVSIANDAFSVRVSVLVLYEMYLTYPLMRVHIPPGGPGTPSSEMLLC
jgi:hypothetical protein